MDEDCGMENTVGVEVEVLDAVVPQKAFEEIAGRQRESALREAREHWNLILALLHGVRVPGGGPPTVHLLLTDESAVEESQQILGLHLRFFSTRGLDLAAVETSAALLLWQPRRPLRGPSSSRRSS
jgi:hypothetical protein